MRHTGPIAAVAASGAYIATAGYDNRLILWNARNREPLARSLHDHLVNHCAFSSDGQFIASASSDYSARIWEVPTMRLKAALVGHEDDVDMAVFSPDDTLVATCALDRTLKIFDLSGRCLNTLHGHTGNILSVAWSKDGKRLVSTSVDGTVREWDAGSGAQLRCNDMNGVRTDTLEIDSSGRIFAGDDDGRIVVIKDGQATFTRAHDAGIKKLVFDEQTHTIITLSYDRKIAIWSVAADGSIIKISDAEFPPLIWARSAALIGPNKVAVGTFGSSYGIYDWEKQTWDMDGIVPDASLNAVRVANGIVYSIGDSGTVYQNGSPICDLGSLCNFLLPVGDFLLSGGQLGKLFNARTGEVVYQHHSPLNCGATFTRNDGLYAVIGTYTGEALVFSLNEGNKPIFIEYIKIYENAIKGIAVRGDVIFSVCASRDICWHRTSDFSLIRRIQRAHERIANACCVVGENAFASVGRDLTLRIWEGEKRDVYQTPHPNSVKCMAVSSDGNTIMTGAYTGTVAAFDVRLREWTSFKRISASGISSIDFDARENCFLASSYDGQIYKVE